MATTRGTLEAGAVVDILGEPFHAETIPLAPDVDGEVVATLVSRGAPIATTKAVLYIHGYSDYFFQVELAQWWVDQGYDFYAIDLRRYGRSLRAGQTPYFVRDLSQYFEELDAALALIRERDGHDRVVVNAHSTGGLIASLWSDARRGDGLEALVLNSPWLELQTNWFGRRAASVVYPLGAVAPKAVLRKGLPSAYPESIHRDHKGEWDFNLEWKPMDIGPAYAGWMRAIRRGHAQVHRGLEVNVPVLLMISSKSDVSVKAWSPEVHGADVVVDVRQTARKVHRLSQSQHVSVMRFEGAMHDVVLSREPVRERVYAAMGKWLEGYVA